MSAYQPPVTEERAERGYEVCHYRHPNGSLIGYPANHIRFAGLLWFDLLAEYGLAI